MVCRNENKSFLAREGNWCESPPASLGKHNVRNLGEDTERWGLAELLLLWAAVVLLQCGGFHANTLIFSPPTSIHTNFFFAVYLHFNRFYSSISERIKT